MVDIKKEGSCTLHTLFNLADARELVYGEGSAVGLADRGTGLFIRQYW